MNDLATPYMWSDNLSVDNALNSRQIIHQLITKINELVELYNDIDIDMDTKIDSKITKELTALEKELSSAIKKAFEQSIDYTDITEQQLNDKIEKVSKEGKNAILALEDELKEYTDTKILEINTKIMELYAEFDKLAVNSFASISPLDGCLKSNRDCFYDMLHVFQRQNSINLDGIIAMAMFMTGSNFPRGSVLMPTNLDNLLYFCNESKWGANALQCGIEVNIPSVNPYNMQIYSRVPPTWGNIVSCGVSALSGLGKTAEGYTVPQIWGSEVIMYNMYNNADLEEGNTLMPFVTGTEFKPFDITKM